MCPAGKKVTETPLTVNFSHHGRVEMFALKRRVRRTRSDSAEHT